MNTELGAHSRCSCLFFVNKSRICITFLNKNRSKRILCRGPTTFGIARHCIWFYINKNLPLSLYIINLSIFIKSIFQSIYLRGAFFFSNWDGAYNKDMCEKQDIFTTSSQVQLKLLFDVVTVKTETFFIVSDEFSNLHK